MAHFQNKEFKIYCSFWRIMMYLGAMISKNKTGEKKFGKYED